jgi:hypothetical protein
MPFPVHADGKVSKVKPSPLRPYCLPQQPSPAGWASVLWTIATHYYCPDHAHYYCPDYPPTPDPLIPYPNLALRLVRQEGRFEMVAAVLSTVVLIEEVYVVATRW